MAPKMRRRRRIWRSFSCWWCMDWVVFKGEVQNIAGWSGLDWGCGCGEWAGGSVDGRAEQTRGREGGCTFKFKGFIQTGRYKWKQCSCWTTHAYSTLIVYYYHRCCCYYYYPTTCSEGVDTTTPQLLIRFIFWRWLNGVWHTIYYTNPYYIIFIRYITIIMITLSIDCSSVLLSDMQRRGLRGRELNTNIYICIHT